MRTTTRFIFASALLTTGIVSSSAFAQTTCPAPTLIQCRDPQYLETDCGKAAKVEGGACSPLLNAAYQAEINQGDVSVDEVMLPEQPGVTAAAAKKKYKFNTHITRNLLGQFTGTTQRSQLLNSSGGTFALFTDGATKLGLQSLKSQRQAWETNSNVVQSCTEYVHERFYDYMKYRDLADVDLLSDPAVFDAAFTSGTGIANKTLKSRSGLSTLTPIKWPSNGQIGTIIIGGKPVPMIDVKAPKNGFFKAYTSLMRGSFFADPARQAIKSKLFQGKSHHVVDWNYHQNTESALSTVDPETLEYYDALAKDFLRLVDERNVILDLIAANGPVIVKGEPAVERNLQAELDALDASIWKQLQAADGEGCLNPTGTNKCDWSYGQMREQIDVHYAKEMEAAFAKCIDYTGGNFAMGSPVLSATTFGAPKDDFTTNAEEVEKFYGVVNNWVAAEGNLPRDPVTKKPVFKDRKSDEGTIGSGEISLDWKYDTGWELTGLDSDAETCSVNVSVDGAFSAVGHAYGTDVKVLDAGAHIYTEEAKGKAKIKLYVVNKKIWDNYDNPKAFDELKTSFVRDFKDGAKKEFTTTVYPFGIPVTLGAGVGMEVGLKINAKAAVEGTCASTPNGNVVTLASVNGTVMPWAKADAFATAAIGISGFRAGLKCELLIVKGEMPITADAKLTMNENRKVYASMSLVGKQHFDMLDGKIKAFVDAPLDFMDSEWTLFGWEGPEIEGELFRFEKKDLPLDTIKNLL